MPSFDVDDITSGRFDWALFQNGPVHLFWRLEVLEQAVAAFAKEGYLIHDIDAGHWTSAGDMHDAMSREFTFPNYYGGNLAALNDCLSDVAYYSYGSRRDTPGTVLVLRHFDRLASADRGAAYVLLHCYADQTRHALLIGHRMICLVQSDDPDISFDPIGQTSVMWNPAEWQDFERERGQSG